MFRRSLVRFGYSTDRWLSATSKVSSSTYVAVAVAVGSGMSTVGGLRDDPMVQNPALAHVSIDIIGNTFGFSSKFSFLLNL